MLRHTLVAAIGGLLAPVLVAAPAHASTYAVSLTVSAPQADVGQTVKLTGSVTGPSATGKTVLVQRRIGDGAWTTLSKPKTSSARTYTYSHKVTALGDQQFRVIAPTTGSTKQGVSPARSFTGFTWLWLAQQPHYAVASHFWDSTPSIAGASRPHSIEITSNGEGISWVLDNQCDDSDISFGTYVNSSTGEVETEDGGQSYQAVPGQLIVSDNVTPASERLMIGRSAGSLLVVASPRVHCSVARLPEPTT